jgi:RNA recognition motif-containing protein
MLMPTSNVGMKGKLILQSDKCSAFNFKLSNACNELKNVSVLMIKLKLRFYDIFRVVEFASSSDMRNAIEKLDDTELNGRHIRLVEDKPRKRGRYVTLVIVSSFSA